MTAPMCIWCDEAITTGQVYWEFENGKIIHVDCCFGDPTSPYSMAAQMVRAKFAPVKAMP
jgi:protein-disulfide isomerase